MDGHTSSSQQLPPFTTAKLQFAPLARQYIWLDFLLSLIEVPQLRWRSSKRTPIKSPPDESGLILLVEIPLKKTTATRQLDLVHIFFNKAIHLLATSISSISNLVDPWPCNALSSIGGAMVLP